MAEQILQVEGLTARVEDKVILHEVGLTIKKGETHVLMGRTVRESRHWVCSDRQSQIQRHRGKNPFQGK